ncbi:MAG: hypothetical protein AAFY59_00655 [Pseudomonadota bacterium]
MSVTQTNAQGGPNIANAALVAIALAVVAGFAYLILSTNERPLARSAMGHDGLVKWLATSDIPVQKPYGLQVEAKTIGLRVLPLHDTDLANSFEAPEDREAYLRTGTEYDIRTDTVRRKIDLVETLVIAPKWMRGARHSGYAHASLLLKEEDAARPLRQLGLGRDLIFRPRALQIEFQDVFEGQPNLTAPISAPLTASLYAPQLFKRDLPEACTPLFSARLGHLLIRCALGNSEAMFLSDPDLMNNHGLHQGRNAELAAAFLEPYAQKGPILVDTSAFVFLTPEPPDLRRREWSDLLRFFEYPLSLLWAALGAAACLALWRSWVRFGPVDRPFNDEMRAAKSVSIAAKARLMRMSDREARVFEAYIQSRLRWLDQLLHGPHSAEEDLLRRTVGQIKRKNPELAKSFGAAAAAALSQHTHATPATLMSLADRFEAETEKVLNEFGRSPRPRG